MKFVTTNFPFPAQLPPDRPVPAMPFNPDNYEDALL